MLEGYLNLLQGICWLVEFKFNLDKWAGIVGKVTWDYGQL